jgi:hypothetical protein
MDKVISGQSNKTFLVQIYLLFFKLYIFIIQKSNGYINKMV